MDLLLYLIKKDHLNIYDIPLVKVIEQYLQFLELMKLLNIDVASEYLVMAANLINIKSKMLLPQKEEVETSEEDPRDELIRKLFEYEKFKEAGEFLKTKELERNRYFKRVSQDHNRGEVYIEASIFDLINAFKTALREVPKDIFFEVVKDEFTVEQKIHDLLHLILVKDKISLQELFASAKNKQEIVVTFLAILELMKLEEIVAVQEELFGEILITRSDTVYSSL